MKPGYQSTRCRKPALMDDLKVGQSAGNSKCRLDGRAVLSSLHSWMLAVWSLSYEETAFS